VDENMEKSAVTGISRQVHMQRLSGMHQPTGATTT